MATTMTRFEVQIPITGDPNQQAAKDQFLDNIGTLCKFAYNAQYVFASHDLSGNPPAQYVALIYGLITAAQQPAALGFLNTLNAAFPSPVVCIVSQVTAEP